jgi:hypothetical protein
VGTWGAGPFDNDAAADWLDQLDDSSALEQITVALAAAATEGPIPADAAAVAAAAAEVVARSGSAGAFGPRLREQDLADGRLARHALSVVDRISADSELASLWDEAGAEQWHGRLDELRAVLRQVAQRPPAVDRPEPTTYTCSGRGHSKRLLNQTGAGLAVAAWHAETAARGDRDRLIGVRAELLDVIDRHSDPPCPIRNAASDLLLEVEACIGDATRPTDSLAAGIDSLRARATA